MKINGEHVLEERVMKTLYSIENCIVTRYFSVVHIP